jgi:hypothetical protein
MRGYGGRRRLPDVGEIVGMVLLAVMGLWGVWFAVQSLITLWWPINVAYFAAGALVAGISAAVARAMLNR